MFKISDNLKSLFSNYTNFKCTYFFANETTFVILGTQLWPLSASRKNSTPTRVSKRSLPYYKTGSKAFLLPPDCQTFCTILNVPFECS